MNPSYQTQAKQALSKHGETLLFFTPPNGRNKYGITIIQTSSGDRLQVMQSRKRRAIGALVKNIARNW